ncbi:MAG: BamA/TamA family outer membrane protein [Ferruginibacter sp.]
MKIVCAHWIKKSLAMVICCSFILCTHAQQSADSKNGYFLAIHYIDKDSLFKPQELKLQSTFSSEPLLYEYMNKLPQLLASKGYPVASVDSFWTIESTIHVNLFIGTKYNWVQLTTSGIDKKALEETGFRDKNFSNKPVNLIQVQVLQERILNYYEKDGYPFASVYLDSVQINNDSIHAVLKADKGVIYHIDSIRIIGKPKISKKFLQHYLYIPNGSVYNKQKLEDVDRRILELPYLKTAQPSDLTMLGTGAVLNLYVQPKKSSQVNFIIGFLPAANNTGKLQLTGDVNLDLKNLLGSGEGILLKWQQLQPKSPRLNLGYNQPYILNSAFGFDFLFDLFKKDSSYLQVNAQLGLQYLLSANKTGKIFIQWQNTTLLSGGIDTNQVRATKKLPPNIDVSSVNVGLNYEWIKTSYRFNPRYGNEVNIATAVGIKNVKQNTDIVSLKDPTFNYATLYDSIKTRNYQLRIKLSGAHFFSLGKSSVLKTALNTGAYLSPSIFRNELFQIGGYSLLRGFDEESIYATRYGVATAEFRQIIDLNSYLSFFADYGATKNKYQQVNVNNQFIGVGIGLVYEAKLGLINISYAIGKRDDVKFNLKESSKIHFGYINYF